jgi:hypothetical protein
MHEIPNIITERVDDIPLLLEQMQRMGLPTLLDDHFRSRTSGLRIMFRDLSYAV